MLGSYTLTYNVSDSTGNAATAVTRRVNVVDQTAPVITLIGANPLEVALGSSFTDPGASDAVDGDLSTSITVAGTVDTNTLGSYSLTYSVSDAEGNAATPVQRSVLVTDQIAPVITLIGANPQAVEAGSTYGDPGASASDNVDGDLSASISVSGSVDTAVPASYTLSYDVTDAAGNVATTVTRSVVVSDQTAPLITLNGANPMSVEAGSTFTDPGASASDTLDGDLSASVVVSGSVNTAALGGYTLTYDVSDAAGNAAIAVTRMVNVVDTTAPVISLTGDNPLVVIVDNSYTEPGATATDNLDGDISASLAIDSSAVDTATIGSYSVTYDVTDASGNAATQLTRTVQVVSSAPNAPTNVTMSIGFKRFQFSWDASLGADHYRLMVNPDGVSGYSVVAGADSITLTSHTIDIPVHLHNWPAARYMVEACDAAESACAGSAELTTVAIDSVAAIGYFKPGTASNDDNFGYSVAMSADGTTLAVGAPQIANGGAGAVHIFYFAAGSWNLQQVLTASNAGSGDQFGASVALNSDGTTLAVGVNAEDSDDTGSHFSSNGAAPDSGAVYIFTRSGATWNEQTRLKAATTEAGDDFGYAVALSADGNTLAVGADLEDGGNDGINTPTNNTETETEAGAAYVFNRTGTSWSEQAYIKSDHSVWYDHVGISVALSGDGTTLAVGAIGEDSDALGNWPADAGKGSGAVFVYTRNSGSWSQQTMLKAANAGRFHRFGSALAFSSDGNTLAVGAKEEDSNTTGVDSTPNPGILAGVGAAYVFGRSGTTWSQQAYIKASTRTSNYDYFGFALALSSDGNLLAVGSHGENSSTRGVYASTNSTASNAGAVFVYERSGVSWASKTFVKSSNTDSKDSFGWGMAISGDGGTLAVGAYREDSSATGINPTPGTDATADENVGAVYLY